MRKGLHVGTSIHSLWTAHCLQRTPVLSWAHEHQRPRHAGSPAPPRRRILGGCPSPHPARPCSICVPKCPEQVPFVFRWCPQNGPRITLAQLRNGTEWNKTEHIFPKPAWKSPVRTGLSGPTASIRDGQQGHNQSVSASFGRLRSFRIRSSATERPHLTGLGGHADAPLARTSAGGYLDCPIPSRVTGQNSQCPAFS